MRLERISQHCRLTALREPLVEILPRAEARPAPVNERAARRVALGLIDRAPELAVHALRKGIEPLRPIERNAAIPGMALDQDRFLFHEDLLPDLVGRVSGHEPRPIAYRSLSVTRHSERLPDVGLRAKDPDNGAIAARYPTYRPLHLGRNNKK